MFAILPIDVNALAEWRQLEFVLCLGDGSMTTKQVVQLATQLAIEYQINRRVYLKNKKYFLVNTE